MMTYFKNLFLFTGLAVILTGCSFDEAGAPPHYFGNSVKQNIAAQVVNPDAPKANIPPEYIGARTAVAQGRYVSDEVEPVKSLRTSETQSGGGS